MGAQFAQINKPIDLTQKMNAWDAILEAKLIKQLRLSNRHSMNSRVSSAWPSRFRAATNCPSAQARLEMELVLPPLSGIGTARGARR